MRYCSSHGNVPTRATSIPKKKKFKKTTSTIVSNKCFTYEKNHINNFWNCKITKPKQKTEIKTATITEIA